VLKNGEIIPVELSVECYPILTVDLQPYPSSAISESVKLAQEKLLKSREKYSTIVEKGNDGIVILEGGAIRFANSRMHILTGLSDEETIGKAFIEFVSEQFRPMVSKCTRKEQLER